MDDGPGHENSPIIVFRPKRRCPRCGLINADDAPRCRRCRTSFAGVDRAAESQRLVERVRAHRTLTVVLAAALLAGLGSVAYGLYERFGASGRYAADFRAAASDARAVERGARSDASALAEALDDAELRATLADQADAWKDRVAKCDALRAKLDELAPTSPDQAREQMRVAERLADVRAVSDEIARAARAPDLAAVRAAAARLAGSGS